MTETPLLRFFAVARPGAGALALAAPFAAFAHHAHDYAPPANGLEGLVSGLAHPVLALPHLAALIVIGLIAAGSIGSPLLLAAFCGGSAMTAVAFAAGAQGWPLHDAWVALSLALGGWLLWKPSDSTRLHGTAGLMLVAVAGSIHGQIAAESIETVQTAILVSYWAGIVIAQLAIAGAVLMGWRRLARNRAGLAQRLRIAGAALSAGVAVTALLGVV